MPDGKKGTLDGLADHVATGGSGQQGRKYPSFPLDAYPPLCSVIGEATETFVTSD